MGRLLVVNTNRERGPFPIPPIGACLVADAAAQDGHEVRFVDLCFERAPEQALERALRDTRPDLIGISIRNIDNSNMARTRFYLPAARRLVQAARKSARVVIGGAAVSVAAGEVMDYVGADCAVWGDGEEPIRRLMRGDSAESIAGLFVRDSAGVVRRSGRSEGQTLSATGRTGMWRWVDTARYFQRNSPLPFQSKRGCIFRCVYCTYTSVEGTAYRLKDAQEAADELAGFVAATGARRVEFVDSTFNIPENFALGLCQAIAARSDLRAVALTTSGFNPSGHSDELLPLMERIGFTSVVCTPESASDEVLQRLKKGFTTQHLARTVEARKRTNLPFLWVFLLGGPGETERTVDETFRFVEGHIPREDAVFLTVGLRVYPYTELAEIADAAGDLLEPVFYLSPDLPPGWLERRVRSELDAHPNYVTISDTQHRLLPLLNRGLALLRSDLPLWHFAPAVNRVRTAVRG